MSNFLIKDTCIVNEGKRVYGDLLIKNGIIEKVGGIIKTVENIEEINGKDLHLLPGVIDDQVHFREPGLTHKANIYSESKAAVAGGTTSFMEMPNTQPPTFTQELLEQKYEIASKTSLANYSFYMGTSNSNIDEVLKCNEKKNDVCGIKIFMGSSTGNLLVDNISTIENIFENSELLIATHCEEESIIKNNLEELKKVKTILTADDHAIIRNEEACFESSLKAIQIAKKYNTRLHILHISTEKELILFSNMLPLAEKRITAEVCVHHLHFTANDYKIFGNQIKCNPAIKPETNKNALWEALIDDRLDIIATDHAPHTWEEKNEAYEKAHAGIPLVQHSLLLMLQYVQGGKISLEKVVNKMSHSVATCFQISNRGFIKEGYFADLVLINLNKSFTVNKNNIYYKCNWSPFENHCFNALIEKTFVNGNLVYNNGNFIEHNKGLRLRFNR
jgi:dihydroorotase